MTPAHAKASPRFSAYWTSIGVPAAPATVSDTAMGTATDAFGRIDTLVSVAAIRPLRDPWEYTAQEWLDVFALNVQSVYLAVIVVASCVLQGI